MHHLDGKHFFGGFTIFELNVTMASSEKDFECFDLNRVGGEEAIRTRKWFTGNVVRWYARTVVLVRGRQL